MENWLFKWRRSKVVKVIAWIEVAILVALLVYLVIPHQQGWW